MDKYEEVTFEDLKARFGTVAAITRHFGITRNAVERWQRDGIPPKRQLELLREKYADAD